MESVIDAIASYLVIYYLFVERKHHRIKNGTASDAERKKVEKRITKNRFITLAIVSVAAQVLWIILYKMWFHIAKLPDAALYKKEIGISILILRQIGYVGVLATVAGLTALWFLRFKGQSNDLE